jgi:3-oxoadipate enol-lactonase
MTAVEVHHEVAGVADAPVVVLCNSLGASLEMWDPQLGSLTEHFRVVRFDARGHGRSPVPPGPYSLDDFADDIIELLDRLEVTRAHLVGLSLGGMTAMRLAIRDPARVDRLALLCTAARLGPPRAWAERAALVRAEGMSPVAAVVVTRWLTEEHRNADPACAARLVAMLEANPVEGYASSCAAVEHMDLRAELAAIAAPTLAIAGAEDPVTPPALLEEIVNGIAGSRLAVVERAAHLVNLDQPEQVDRLLLTHLTAAPDQP